MSYQTTSSWRYQTTLPKGRRMTEYQRLKNEYERVKDFSDNTIALRIRQVRLWRLFREIQDINANTLKSPNLIRKHAKTEEETRAEMLARARELGIEYSRENCANYRRYTRKPLETQRVENKVSTTARRLRYGNISSHQNMNRFRLGRRLTSRKVLDNNIASNTDDDSTTSLEAEQLKEYIGHDEFKTRLGTLKEKRYVSKELVKKDNEVEDEEEEIVQIPKCSGNALKGHDLIRNYTFVVDESSNQQSESNSQNANGQDLEYLIGLWNELKSRVPILRLIPLKELINSQGVMDDALLGNQDSSDSNAESIGEEYTLREINNDLDLPKSEFGSGRQKRALEVDSNEDIPTGEHEKIVKISKYDNDLDEYYYDDNNSEQDTSEGDSREKLPTAEREMSKANIPEEIELKIPPQPNLKNKPLPNLDAQRGPHSMILEPQVNDFVKLYEPFPCFHKHESQEDTKAKYESGVVKLRSIFEHQVE